LTRPIGPGSRLSVRLAALTPLWVLLIVSIASRTYFDAMLAKPPEILGIPLAAVIDAIAIMWMLIGLVLIWDTRSQLIQSLVLALFTIPATLLVVIAPAVIVILQNFG
jgi:hypothetical protein